MSESIDPIADAVLAVPGVIALSEDPDAGAPSSRGENDGVGITTREASTSVHVQIDAAASVRVTAERVQRATHDITGGPVDVTIEEVR